MTGTQVFGLIIGLIGLLFTLSIVGAILGIPMMIVGGMMLVPRRGPTQVNQVIVQQPQPYQPPPALPQVQHPALPQGTPQQGDVVNGHIYKMATDGRCYWYQMTEAEQRQHRIRRMEDDLGMSP